MGGHAGRAALWSHEPWCIPRQSRQVLGGSDEAIRDQRGEESQDSKISPRRRKPQPCAAGCSLTLPWDPPQTLTKSEAECLYKMRNFYHEKV